MIESKSTLSKRKASIINLIINYANTFFLIINGLVLVPIYFKYFTLNIYGSYLAAANIAGILGLLEFGLSLILTQKLSFYYKLNDLVSFSKYTYAGLVTSTILLLSLIIIACSISSYVPGWVKTPISSYYAIKYAFVINAIGLGLNFYSNTLTSIFQAWSKVQISGIINVVSAFLGVLSTIIALLLGYGVISISLGIFVKGLFCILGQVPFLLTTYKRGNYPKAKFEKEIFLSVMRDSLPVFGNTVSKSVIDNAQLLIITTVLNPTITAIYSLTSKLYQMCNNFLAPIGSSIFSSLSQLVAENNLPNLKANVLKIFSLFTIFSIMILSISFALNKSFIEIWVGRDKFGGLILSLALCINVFLSSRFAYINFNLFALGIFGKTVFYDQLGAILRVILIFVFISIIGVAAIPLSEMISTIIFSGYFLNKLFIQRMEFDKKEKHTVLFFGLIQFSVLIILGLIYQQFYIKIESWSLFILSGSIVFIIISIFLFSVNRIFIREFMGKFLKRKA